MIRFIFISFFLFANVHESPSKSFDISEWKCQKFIRLKRWKREKRKIHIQPNVQPSIINNPTEITALNSFLLPATWIIRFSRKKSESHMVTFSEGKANIEALLFFFFFFFSPPYIQGNIKKGKRFRRAVYLRVCPPRDRKSRAAILHNPHRGLIIARRKASG